jgi:hypothetical protein
VPLTQAVRHLQICRIGVSLLYGAKELISSDGATKAICHFEMMLNIMIFTLFAVSSMAATGVAPVRFVHPIGDLRLTAG